MPDDHFIDVGDKRLMASLEIDTVLHSWHARISDTIGDTSQSLIAHATMVPVQPEFRKFRMVVGDEKPVELSQMEARLILHRRGPGPVLEKQEADDADKKTEPSIGSIMFMEPDRRFFEGKVSLFAQLEVDAFLFDGLMARHEAGIEMPVVMRLQLTQRGIFDVVEKKPELVLAFGRMREVTALRWTSDTDGVGEHASEGTLLHGAFRRALQRYPWEEQGCCLVKPQFLDITSELIASAILSIHRGRPVGMTLESAIMKAIRASHEFFDLLAVGEALTRKQRRQGKRKKETDLDRDIMWSKRDPQRDFSEGFDNPWRSSIDRSKIDGVVQNYLDSGMTSPTLEFILADILAYVEIRDYGDVLKNRPAAVGWIVSLHDEKCRRNLLKMQLYALPWQIAWGVGKKAIWLGLPLLVAVGLWGDGRHEEAWLVLAGIAAIAFGGERMKGWFFTSKKERLEKAKEDIARLVKMNDAYRLLYKLGSPFIARESLQAAADQGAVWPELLWQVVLKAEARNRVTWETDDPQYRLLRGEVSRELTEAYLRQERAGTSMPEPDLNNWDKW